MVVTKKQPAKSSQEASKLLETVFEEFSQANDSVEILVGFQKLKTAVGAENLDNGKELYGILKSKLQSWKCKSLWEVLDARAKQKEYGNGTICEDMQVLIIGAGPIGLRTAIEVALLGARVIVVEKRTAFSRNNVLHLWPFLIQDFRSLGAKRFYGKFCAGSLDHISIRILQCMLMKTALILGVQIFTGVTFEKMLEPIADSGWRCQLNPPFHPASQFDFDMVIGADGKKNVLPDFPQIEMRGSLAIGITLNLVYHATKEEAAIAEVSGLAYHFKPQFFDELYQKCGVRLENFVYYKNETHYFVMTAVKSSLLARGALLMDYPKPSDLLAPQNVNLQKLAEYALDAVKFGTEGKLTNMEFVINDRGKPDIAVFDFTSLKKAEHAARIVERKGYRLLMTLVGDSLIEPFWPTGSGCARGVLSALDTAWMLRSFAMDKPPLQVLSERECVYKLLSATTVGNLRKKFEAYTINPSTRYADVNLKRVKEVYHLYDSDDPVNADFRTAVSPTSVGILLENTKRRLSSANRQAKIGKSRRKSSSDDLDEKRDAKTAQKKSKFLRSLSRETDEDLHETPTGKTKTKSRKGFRRLKSRQSSESADEDARVKRQRKLGRTKSKDTDGSNNSLDTITEGTQKTAKGKPKDENMDNSTLMKQRSTKRWRLFGGTKPRQRSPEKNETPDKKKHDVGNEHDKGKRNVRHSKKELKTGSSENQKVEKKADPGKVLTTSAANQNGNVETKRVSSKPPFARSISRQQSSQGSSSPKPLRSSLRKPSELPAQRPHSYAAPGFTRSISEQVTSTPKPLRNSLRKPSELRTQKAESRASEFSRSISHSGLSTLPRAASDKSKPPVKRTDNENKRKERLFSSLRRSKPEKDEAEEKAVVTSKETPQPLETKATEAFRRDSKQQTIESGKKGKSVSVFEDIKSLSPTAQRTAPVLATLTPEKKNANYSEGGAVSAVAGIAALVALTTPLAMEEQVPLKEFQRERQKILSSGQVNVKEKIALLNSAGNNKQTFRRDLSAAMDSTDGSPKPVQRFFSFSAAQRNVKEKLEEDSYKSLTLPRKNFGRHSLQNKPNTGLTDIPSALDSAIDILIKQYQFKEIKNTLKLMLAVFRCISKDPDDEMCRRVCTNGDTFRSLVWNIKEAKLFMIVSGWMEIGSFILLSKSKTVHEPIRVLMQNYRMMSSQQYLDTSCPPYFSPENANRHRRVNDDVFRPPELRRSSSGLQYAYGNPGELVKDDGKDTESHSSDSGMGFSETASENNIAAVLTYKTACDVDNDVADDAFGNDVGDRPRIGQRNSIAELKSNERIKIENECTSQAGQPATDTMDPKKYLENSYRDQGPNLDPALYIKNDSNEPLPVVEELASMNIPSSAGKKHNWEILGQTSPAPLSPKGVQYAPSLRDEQERGKDQARKGTVKDSSSNRGKRLSAALDAHLQSFDEPMDQDTIFTSETTKDPSMPTQIPQHQQKDTATTKQSGGAVVNVQDDRTKSKSAKKRGKESKKNELDDLFDTLDFVSEVLEPPRVVCEEKSANERKKSRKPKSTEATRRREYHTRSKLRGALVEEQPSPRSKRRARNQEKGKNTNEGRVGGEIQKEPQKSSKKREKNSSESNKNIKSRKYQNNENGETAADHTDSGSSGSPPLLLRRSRRIAESSENGRKAVLRLNTSGFPEESSTDLNQAFVNSTLGDSQEFEEHFESGRVVHESSNVMDEAAKGKSQKKKVRRKSSIVKTNKSRARVNRTAFKSRKDRSFDT